MVGDWGLPNPYNYIIKPTQKPKYPRGLTHLVTDIGCYTGIYKLRCAYGRLTVIIISMDNHNTGDKPQFSEDDPRDPSYFNPFDADESNSSIDNPEEWVTDDDVQALTAERDIMGYDEYQQAENILKENLPAITHAVVKLARSASSETVRLNAAKYIIDRNLGKVTEPESKESNPTQEFLEGVVVSN